MTVGTLAAPATMDERQFQSAVIDAAHTFGWMVAAFRPAQTAHGWRTPVQGDGKGWPDLVLVHPERRLVWFRELKVGKRAKLDPAQRRWAEVLDDAGANWLVWRPDFWPEIIHQLSGGKATAL